LSLATAQDVVVMTTHDIGRHLHCYGLKSVASPNLDSLASSGVRFELAFATAPQCSPSRASLATGRYPHNNGVMGLAHRGFDWELTRDASHAAAIFAGLGFETHLFGAQHVTQHPERLGFDQMHPIEAVEQVLASKPRERRLYLEINFDETHRPYPPPGPIPRDLVIPGYLPDGREAAEEMTALEGTITRMDSAAGRVLAALDEAGRAERALVVFTTDHGLAMPRAKCTLYDPGLEVALMMRWPDGGIDRVAVQVELVSNIDVLPTLLEAAAASPPDGIQGRSLLPLLRAAAYEPRNAIFAEKTFHSYYDPMRCVRTRRHKYIRNFETGFAVEVPADIQQGPIFRANPSRYSTDRPNVVELYDLEADLLEENNVAGSPSLKVIEEELSAQLWNWMQATDDPLLNGPVASPRYRQAMQP
jgi:arylsulfatase A-like enzyme